MKFCIRQKKNLQGHRKRRRDFDLSQVDTECELTEEEIFELKVLSQYHSFGEVLDTFKLYGYRNGFAFMRENLSAYGFEQFASEHEVSQPVAGFKVR